MAVHSDLLGDEEPPPDEAPEADDGLPPEEPDSLDDAPASYDEPDDQNGPDGHSTDDQDDPAPPGGSPMAGMTEIERKAASEAYRKVLAGQGLTAREQALLKRLEKEKEERLRWQYYSSIPQKHWRTMSGRQTKVLHEQASRYGLPLGGPTINLPALARAFHDFLADNAHKLAKEDDELLQGSGSPALERYREERAALARLDRLERERQLIPRDEVRNGLARVAVILRSAGDSLQRQFGSTAVEILYEALEDAEREIDRAYGDGVEQPGEPPDASEQPPGAE